MRYGPFVSSGGRSSTGTMEAVRPASPELHVTPLNRLARRLPLDHGHLYTSGDR